VSYEFNLSFEPYEVQDVNSYCIGLAREVVDAFAASGKHDVLALVRKVGRIILQGLFLILITVHFAKYQFRIQAHTRSCHA
jgi:hypothetical protein